MADMKPPDAGTGMPQASRRGRPRQIGTDQAILRATIELLNEGGMAAATIDAIAARSGSAKSTVYRRWPTRDALMLDALRAAVKGTHEHVDEVRTADRAQGSPIRASAHNILALSRDRVFRAAFPIIARELFEDTPIGERFRREVFRPVRGSLRERLSEEVVRGVIRSDVDLDLLLDLVNGAVLYRALVGESLTEEIADQVADLVLRAASAPASELGPG